MMRRATPLALALLLGAGWVGTALAQQAPVKSTPESVAAGKALFEQNCAMCHGNGGKGDGPAASALQPKPANLAAGNFKHGGTPPEVFKTITSGVPGTAMVGWSSIPEKDRWNLVNFVKSLSEKK